MTSLPPPSAAEIAAIRRLYYLMAASVCAVDVAMNLVFIGVSDAWHLAPRNLTQSVLVLLGANLALAWLVFRPIDEFLAGRRGFDGIQRRMTQLPLFTARNVGLLSLAVIGLRVTTPFWDPSATAGLVPGAWLDALAVTLVLSSFYFVFTYFVVSDYLAKLGAFVFRHWGRNLELYFGSYAVKLGAAFFVMAVAPMVLVLIDVFSYRGDDVRTEVTVDAISSLFGIGLAVYFVSRSLIRPLRILAGGMAKVADGDLGLRLPVTSNDEVGRLTGEFNRMVGGLQERAFIREAFGKYVSESVAAAIVEDTGREGHLHGETRVATVLFTDIDGFTGLSERLPPDRLIGLLNEYLEAVLEPIQRRGGVVSGFIGDGLFASFNLPLHCEGHAAAALDAALDIQERLADRRFAGEWALPTRIGVNTGQVIGGTIGAGERLSYTLLGDSVNIAARLMDLNKSCGTRILASGATLAAAGPRFRVRRLGMFDLRGRAADVEVLCVEGREP